MKRETAEAAIFASIGLIDAALSEADAMAKAARHCVQAGQGERAFQIALDIKPLLNEADSLLQAAAVIRRRVDTP